MDMCSSPLLIAAFHVLHRLLVPRHSPHALSSLTIKLVHKQISPANKNDVHYLFLLTILIATCSFSTMYSVIKYQDLEFMIKTLISAAMAAYKSFEWWR